MKGTSTIEEVLTRGIEYPMAHDKETGWYKTGFIFKAFESELKPQVVILQFFDGTQANVTYKTFNQLKEVYPSLKIEVK